MEKKKVLDTVISKRHDIPSRDGRAYARLEIEYPGFACMPGQFVMIGGKTKGFRWSYPFLVQCSTRAGFEVVAGERDDLYRDREGDHVVVWGANGKGLEPCHTLTLIAQPESYFTVKPLFSLADRVRLVMLGGRPPEDVQDMELIFPNGAREAAGYLGTVEGQIAAALDFTPLLEIMQDLTDDIKSRTLVFANTKIGCGISACRACYLHDPDIHVGVPVCCNGPFLPCNSIDLHAERHSLRSFNSNGNK